MATKLPFAAFAAPSTTNDSNAQEAGLKSKMQCFGALDSCYADKAVIPVGLLFFASAFIYGRRMDNEVLRYTSPDGQQSLILDDDGKTGYAYLLDENGKVTADCWLYNRRAAPVENEWKFSKNMPFANSAEYVKPEFSGGFNPPKSDDELSVGWFEQGAELFIQDRLFARLVAGSKPGWSRLAAKDGPLALMLSD